MRSSSIINKFNFDALIGVLVNMRCRFRYTACEMLFCIVGEKDTRINNYNTGVKQHSHK